MAELWGNRGLWKGQGVLHLCVLAFLRRKDPCVTASPCSWVGGLAGEGVDTSWTYLWSLKNADHRAISPQATAFG